MKCQVTTAVAVMIDVCKEFCWKLIFSGVLLLFFVQAPVQRFWATAAGVLLDIVFEDPWPARMRVLLAGLLSGCTQCSFYLFCLEACFSAAFSLQLCIVSFVFLDPPAMSKEASKPEVVVESVPDEGSQSEGRPDLRWCKKCATYSYLRRGGLHQPGLCSLSAFFF